MLRRAPAPAPSRLAELERATAEARRASAAAPSPTIAATLAHATATARTAPHPAARRPAQRSAPRRR